MPNNRMNISLIHIQVLRDISSNPTITQREIANKNGISLGKANYVIKALVKKGYIKIQNFKSSKNKKGYLYILTSKGIMQKAKLTAEFLKRKMQEYDRLQAEIKEIEKELSESRENGTVLISENF